MWEIMEECELALTGKKTEKDPTTVRRVANASLCKLCDFVFILVFCINGRNYFSIIAVFSANTIYLQNCCKRMSAVASVRAEKR